MILAECEDLSFAIVGYEDMSCVRRLSDTFPCEKYVVCPELDKALLHSKPGKDQTQTQP